MFLQLVDLEHARVFQIEDPEYAVIWNDIKVSL
jgi:hypothetical protein